MLKIDKTIENGKAVIAPEGRLDTVTSPDMENAIKETIPGISELTLDLANLEYISSAGLRVLLIMYKALPSGGFKMLNVKPAVQEILETSGFASIFR